MQSEADSDELIASRVQQGDVSAFGVLVRRYEEKISRYARRFLFKGDDIKDVVQEVFLKAYVNIKSFDATRRFSPWLYRIAHNEFINAGRKLKNLPFFTFDLDTLLPNLISPQSAQQSIEQREMKELLDKPLAQLSAKYREPLILYYSEELSYKEIADVLKIPIATVGIRLKRGRDMLRKIIPNS